jgi:hypothetical protein
MRPTLVGLLGLVAVTAPARAESFIDAGAPVERPVERPDAASLRFGDLGDPLVTLGALRAELGLGGDRVLAEVQFRVTTSGLGRREVVLPIILPRGATVHGLVVDTGDGRSRARATSAEDGRDAYQHFVTMRLRDPGLLELRDRDARHDHLQLHLFPVTREAGATVELTIELPRTERFAVDPGPNALAAIGLTINGQPAAAPVREPRAPLVVSLGRSAERNTWISDSLVPAAHVDANTSLFAGPPPVRPGSGVPTVTFSGAPNRGSGPPSLDKRTIRAVVKVHLPQLTECFVHEAQFGKPDLAGKAILHFVIGKSGAILSVVVDGELQDEAVTRCLRTEVARWEFYPADANVEVFYPLDFKIAG